MSTYNDVDIECPNCGHEYRGNVWVAIHAGQDPELKELLQGGELNLVSCPECSHVEFQEHFLIYQDPPAELVAYVYPESQRAQEAELTKLMLAGFNEAQAVLPSKHRLNYDPVLFFGLEELIELLVAEQSRAEQSQIAAVVCEQGKIKTELLTPTHARRLQTVRVIPHVGSAQHPSREEVLGGIERLLAINPALDEYAKLQTLIKSDTFWKL